MIEWVLIVFTTNAEMAERWGSNTVSKVFATEELCRKDEAKWKDIAEWGPVYRGRQDIFANCSKTYTVKPPVFRPNKTKRG